MAELTTLGTVIKATYEAEPDTNAFTDEEKTKLAELTQGGSGAVDSVNGKTGEVILDAEDVGALPDDYEAPVQTVNGQTGAVVLTAEDVGALEDDYTAPVQSVNGQTGAVSLSASDVDALPSNYTPPAAPVQSVNGKTGTVELTAMDVGALTDDYEAPVTTVNGSTGAVVLTAADVGALADDYEPPVTSVNGSTGDVALTAAAIGALADDYEPPVTSVNGSTGDVVLTAEDVGALSLHDMQVNVPIYASVETVQGLNIPPGISAIRTNGYYDPGDGGGALYVEGDEGPGAIQSGDGRWWELAEQPVNVRMFGAKGDGVTDDTQAIKDAIEFVSTPRADNANGGGAVLFDEGQFIVTETLTIDEHNVRLKGVGAGEFGPGIGLLRGTALTRLVWDGPSDDIFVHFTRRTDGTPIKTRGGLSDLMIDCMNIAGEGLRLTSWLSGNFHDLTIYGATQVQIHLTTLDQEYGGAGPYDCHRNMFSRVRTTCLNLPDNNSLALRLDSGGVRDSCYNRFYLCTLQGGIDPGDGPAVVFANCDFNAIYDSTMNGVVFQSTDNTGSAAARYNYLQNCEINAPGIVAEASQTGGTSSHNNVVAGVSNGNSSGGIEVQQGAGGADDAHLLVYDTEGFRTRLLVASISMGHGADKFDKEILKISTDDRDGSGRIWLRTNQTSQTSPFLRVTGGRNDTNIGHRFAGRLFLDSYKAHDAVKINKTLGSVVFGGSVGPNNDEDIRYSAAVRARAQDDYTSDEYCPARLELVAGVAGGEFNDTPMAVVAQIKPNGCVRFMPMAGAPTEFLEEGDAYYDSTLKTLRVYDGTGWVDL